jgi:hypothetical protein
MPSPSHPFDAENARAIKRARLQVAQKGGWGEREGGGGGGGWEEMFMDEGVPCADADCDTI